MPKRSGAWLAGVLVAAMLGGCDEPTTIAEPVEVTREIVDIRNVMLAGLDRLAYSISVPAEAVHPHFAGTWTVADVERPVNLYVFRAADYNPNLPPQDQAYAWPHMPYPSSGIGRVRTNGIAFHPAVGDWVLVFHNPTAGPLVSSRSDLSAGIQLEYLTR
jgi:hypothetical protein